MGREDLPVPSRMAGRGCAGVCHWQPPELARTFSKGYVGGKPVLINVGLRHSNRFVSLTDHILPMRATRSAVRQL